MFRYVEPPCVGCYSSERASPVATIQLVRSAFGPIRAKSSWAYPVARMKDLTHPVWIKAKGLLFLLVGLLAAALLILEAPSWKVAALLALTVWCFCRFYYF